MRVVFRPAAAEEVESAVGWYGRQRVGLGEELLEDLVRTLEVVVATRSGSGLSIARREVPC